MIESLTPGPNGRPEEIMRKPTYSDGDFDLTVVQLDGKTYVQWACLRGSDDPRQRRWIRFRREWLKALSMREWPDPQHAPSLRPRLRQGRAGQSQQRS